MAKYYVARKYTNSTKAKVAWMRFMPGLSLRSGSWLFTSDKELATRYANKDSMEQMLRDAGMVDFVVEEHMPAVEKYGDIDVMALALTLADAIIQRYNQPRMPSHEELMFLLTNHIWSAKKVDNSEDEDEEDDN